MSKSFVTVEQHTCTICGKVYDTGAVLMHKRLANKFDHHTVTGAGICPEDQAMLDQDRIALVGVDPTKSGATEDTKQMGADDAYRTGRIAWMKREIFPEVFNVPLPEGPMVFVEDAVIDMLNGSPDL